ncbi:MAG: alpha/beta fold hydrolase [Actinomycetota bacterium]
MVVVDSVVVRRGFAAPLSRSIARRALTVWRAMTTASAVRLVALVGVDWRSAGAISNAAPMAPCHHVWREKGRLPVEIRILGPIEAVHDGKPLKIGGPRQRLVLAVLLARVGQVVSTDRIVEEVWNEEPPATARPTVQAYVSTLRRVLEPHRPGTLVARPPGYLVELDRDSFDVLRFESLVTEGRALAAHEPEAAVSVMCAAESLWRGDAYGDLEGAPALASEVTRLHELRIANTEGRIDTELALGRHAALIPELEFLADVHPLRERLRAQLMISLYRSGRQAEALRVYQRTRNVLGEELGIEPSLELKHLEELILFQDEGLATAQGSGSPLVPEVRYATTPDGVSIAHCTVGSDSVDLVYVPGWVSNIETMWEHGLPSRFLLGLASFSRLICFDKRGTGLSDRVPVSELPNLETRTEDVRTVLDAVGSEQAILFGVSEGGPMAALFAAIHPDRTRALVLYGAYAARKPSPDYPWAPSSEERERWLAFIEREWGGDVDLRTLAPSMQDDASYRRYWSRYLRSGASPSAAVALGRMNTEIDIRDTVGSIVVPTLVMHRTGDRDAPVEGGRWLADHIPGSRYVEFDGVDHVPQVNSDEILDAIRTFVEELPPPA